MVLSKFGNLARTSFGKTLTHVPQTVVASTQSSYASTGSPFPFNNHGVSKLGKSGNAHLHTSFQSPTAAKSKAAPASSDGSQTADGGLAAYYDAWHKHHQPGAEEREWKQFESTKRIGWKAPTAAVLAGRAKEREEQGLRPEARLDHGVLNRAYSESIVQDLKQSDVSQTEAEALARVDEAIADEITQIKGAAATRDREAGIAISQAEKDVPAINGVPSSESHSPLVSAASNATPTRSPRSVLTGDSTAATSQQSLNHDAYSGQVAKLSEDQRYAEIPPVFEALLANGIRPTIQAYNGLLLAAIHLPVAPHQIVPKALNVYTDLLRREVVPDVTFYTNLIHLLSTRALDTLATKKHLNQQRKRFGDGEGCFLFPSQGTEYNIASQDDSLANAIRIFDSAIASETRFDSTEMFRALIKACALHGKVDEMIRIVSHMESRNILPYASIYPHMIGAFASIGDLASVVECFNGYKALAILDNTGKPALKSRRDHDVYAAVVKAYTTCNKLTDGQRFWGKIRSSYESANVSIDVQQALRDSIIVDGMIAALIELGDFAQAIRTASEGDLSLGPYDRAMTKISIAAADSNRVQSGQDVQDTEHAAVAVQAFNNIDPASPAKFVSAVSMFSLHIRNGDFGQARNAWSFLLESPQLEPSFAEGVALYATALADRGMTDDGLVQASDAFFRIRSMSVKPNRISEAMEKIDEAIEHIGAHITNKGIIPSPQASLTFLRAMIDNRGLVSPVTEHLLGTIGPQDVSGLSLEDLHLALHVQSDIIRGGMSLLDVAHVERFAHLLDNVTATNILPPQHVSEIVEAAANRVSSSRPDLAAQWRRFMNRFVTPVYTPVSYTPQPTTPVTPSSAFADNFDPYAVTTDFRGSNIIAEELDNCRGGSAAALDGALTRFRNMRRAGRHPRYIIYSKLITAAAKESRSNLVHDVLGMARDDMPYLPNNPMVCHGWSSILDAVVGACLTLGNRHLAARFHQELLDMGSAPTANTFGLYITTLKESTKTFDEASEAVKIFQQALSEGVEPSSFLYNALIGKLGKARRIDDCMFYFSDMRTRGIRPTSVTYGTIVNACCRVSDQVFAEQLFDEMESMPNYKPRAAPYNSLMQFFLTTKRDSPKVLAYYERMRALKIEPTMHTYKLLIDTYATLEPINLAAADGVLETIRASGQKPETVHYASLIHAKGCTLRDMGGARQIFNEVLAKGEVRIQACLYQALFESMVANHAVADTEDVLKSMAENGVSMTPYIANTLIHGWATEKDIVKAKEIYESVGLAKREPSTYEAMTRAYLAVADREGAVSVVHEMLGRGYPAAVASKVQDLLGAAMV